MSAEKHEVVAEEWVTFPGGELEGKRPRALCPACREALNRESSTARQPGVRRPRLLCFDCYRADLTRARALKAAGELDTASASRFQAQLPFEPVNEPRLEQLKAARAEARTAEVQGIGQYANKRRRAQIEARHALQKIGEELRARRLTVDARTQAIAAAIHAAELQLPEAWLPYVVSR